MKQAIFNDLLTFKYPDEFKQLTEKENEKYFSGNLLRLSFHNEDKHLLISISKSKDSFMYRLVGLNTIISGTMTSLANNLRDYEYIEEVRLNVLDKPAIKECFSYMAKDQDVKQYGELTAFKNKNALYSIYCLSRYEDKEDAKAIFKEFIDSFEEVK